MLFKQVHLDDIKNGTISLAFRRWNKAAATSESLIKTAVGMVRIKSVEVIDESGLAETDAVKAGFGKLSELLKMLADKPGKDLYRIELEYAGADPRLVLRETTGLPDEDLEEIKTALDRLDRFSKSGAWTKEILLAIRQHPKLKAADLAVMLGREKEWLKLNIRKLKNLGLTISFEPGYMISPRGEEVINRLGQ